MNYNKDFKGYDTVAVFCKAKTETLHPIYSFIIIIYGNYKVPVILAFVANWKNKLNKSCRPFLPNDHKNIVDKSKKNKEKL